MKKKIVTLLLALSIFTLAAGCGDKKEEEGKKETAKTEQAAEDAFVLTNKEGKVVAVDVKNIKDYVKLGEYKNLEISAAPKKEVTEADVEESIQAQLLYRYEQVEVTEDRAVQMDDTANIDFTGYMDGKEFEGGSGTDTELVIGSGSFIKGFEEGLIGHKKGEEVTLDLTFPEDYHVEDKRGKAVQFKVKINKISAPAELTDEWTAANTAYKTVEAFKTAQREEIQQQTDREYQAQIKSDLFTKLVDETEVKDYPKEALEDARGRVKQQLESMYQTQAGKTFDEYIKEQGISQEEADKALTESAKSYLNQNLIVQAVLDAEGVSLTEEEYSEEKEKFALLSGFASAEVMDSMYADQRVIKDSVLWNRACDIIMSTATVKETEEKADADTAGQE